MCNIIYSLDFNVHYNLQYMYTCIIMYIINRDVHVHVAEQLCDKKMKQIILRKFGNSKRFKCLLNIANVKQRCRKQYIILHRLQVIFTVIHGPCLNLKNIGKHVGCLVTIESKLNKLKILFGLDFMETQTQFQKLLYEFQKYTFMTTI